MSVRTSRSLRPRPEAPPRVLYFSRIDFPSPRANSIQSLNTCYELARAGADVVFVVARLLQSRRNCFTYYGLPEHPRLRFVSLSLPVPSEFNAWRGKYFGYYLHAFLRRYRKSDTVVMTRDLAGLELYRQIRSLRPQPRMRLLFEVHKLAFLTKASDQAERGRSFEDPVVRAKIKARRALEAETYASVDGILCTTDGARQQLEHYFPAHAPVRVVPNGARIGRAADGSPRVVSTLDDTGRDLDVLYVGQLYPWKGVDGLLQAMQHLTGRRLTIVGGHEPEDLERLQRLATELDLASRVDFAGQVPPHAVGSYQARARVGVVPLPGAGCVEAGHFTSPLELFELMQAGVPIVASDLPSVRELVRDGEHARLVTADDPVALARAIESLLNDRELAARFVRAAARHVLDYGWEQRARQILDFAAAMQTAAEPQGA